MTTLIKFLVIANYHSERGPDGTMKPEIGLVMIVRNEQANLANCLASVKDHVQEIIIVDTGSTDRTMDIARQYTDKIFEYSWNNDFSAARNYAISKSTSPWILILDADETMECKIGDFEALFKQYPQANLFYLPMHQAAPDIDTWDIFPVLRLFRRTPECNYQGVVHEHLTIPASKIIETATAPVIKHHSHSTKTCHTKHGRNLALLHPLVVSNPEDPIWQYFLGLELFGLGRAQKALPHFQNALRMDDSQVILRTASLRYLTRCLSILDKNVELIGICIKEAKRYSNYSDIYYEGGLFFESKSEWPLAIKWFNKAINNGIPPAGFYHTVGTESFLSLYHLGYCHERQGQFQKAEEYYTQALTINYQFWQPLKNLFFLKLALLGPQDTFRYFNKTEVFQSAEHALLLAQFFSNIGYYCLANNLLNNRVPNFQARDGYLLEKKRAQYQIYSGDWQAAINTFALLRAADCEIDHELATAEIVMLVLMKDFQSASNKAHALWLRQSDRNIALALLNIISLAERNTLSICIEKSRETSVIQQILTIIERCMSYIPVFLENEMTNLQSTMELTSLCITFLTTLSKNSAVALVDYLNEKAATVQKLMQLKYNLQGLTIGNTI
jgi:glycosyltransferase involved in cell wall biosynthesis